MSCDNTITPVKKIIFGNDEIGLVTSNDLNNKKSINITTDHIINERKKETFSISKFFTE